jgi:hypothetical protein
MKDRSTAVWVRSTHSNGQSNCVEVCTSEPGTVAVRDSKDREGPKLAVSNQAWSAFVQGINQGQFDL